MAVRLRSRHTAWIGLAVATIAVVLVVGLAGWRLNPASLKPRLIEAAHRATGRELTISGDVGIKLSLVPTVSMENVALANPPGFSRPDMVTVGRVELRLALWPLLRRRLVVDRVTLVRPDVVLETDAAGHKNWLFTRPAPVAAPVTPSVEAAPPPSSPDTTDPSQPRPAQAPQGTAKRRFTVAFNGASVVDGRFGFIDGKVRHQYFAEAPRLNLDTSRDGPADLTGIFLFDGQTITVSGHAELARMAEIGALPVSLRLETGGATLTAAGRIADPSRGRGYTLALDAHVPDPAVLKPFFTRLPLTAFHDVTAHVDVSDNGGPVPTIVALQVKAGSVDLDTPRFVRLGHEARLNDLAMTGSASVPIQVAANLSLAGAVSTISGTIGDLPWLARGASAPVAVNLEWSGASARGLVRGTIQRPARLAGLALDVAVNVPDPSLVMHDAPAALRDVMFRARLSDASSPTPFQLTSNAGDLTGQVTVSRTPRLTVDGQVWSQHLDVDLLRGHPAAVPGGGTSPTGVIPGAAGTTSGGTGPGGIGSAGSAAIPGSTPPGSMPPGSSPSGSSQTAAGAPPAPASNENATAGGAPQPARGSAVPDNAPLIPDTKLPFDLIRVADGTVRFSFGDVHVDGTDIRKIDGVAMAKDGLLRVDPFTISAIAQRTNGVLVVDASKNPPSVHVVVTAPGLALWPTLAALGLPQMATGTVAVQADLTATGDTPRALAGSVSGSAGVAVENGQLDAEMVNAWLARLRPLHIGGPKVTDLKCFAMRGDAKDGVVAVQPMALDTAALIVEGSGDIDLRHETLSLRVRPRARIGGTGIVLPVRVTGPMRDPSAKIDISGKGFGGGALAGLILGGGKDVMGAAGGGDPCPEALARARAGSPDAAPILGGPDPGQGTPK